MTVSGEALQDIKIDYDAIVIGAGIAGLYQLYKLRKLGLNVRVFEAGTGVGDTITDQNNQFLGDGLGSSIAGHMSTDDYIRIENDTNNSNANNFQCLRIRDVNRSRITLDHKNIVTVSGSTVNGGATNMQVLIKPVFTYADNAVRISDASFFLTKNTTFFSFRIDFYSFYTIFLDFTVIFV